ncbi:beta-galactosidase [Pedobacter sp. HMF7056]|uniref:Beta-galactosidase n=2 Tax=Hufsiella ginkgonis TaxID=2695274 RepID=A0A7K1Y1F6_9SPHI|nr:beta-galactosidase [Hufsiella ginkgonis]
MIKRPIRFLLSLVCLLAVLSTVEAQDRISQTINSNWQFYKGDLPGFPASPATVKWETVSVPHSWNTTDVLDDEPGYYRGTGWYQRRIFVPSSWKGKDIYLYFEGAAQAAEVYVNGKKAGGHTGSYTFFSVPVKELLQFAASGSAVNEIQVKVNNSHNEDVPPLSADFTFFGGLYRDVHLVAVSPVHFDMDNNATNGVFVSTPKVTAGSADVMVKGSFVSNLPKAGRVRVRTTIVDGDGKTVAEQQSMVKTVPGAQLSFSHNLSNLLSPHLWSPETPYLYQVISRLEDADTKVKLDEISNPLGFRWYVFDPGKGFFLNGQPVKLVGTSRHQDFKDMANALPDAMAIRDVELLKAMGGNFLRVAHYPQDPAVLQACDRLGILTSVEIPVVNQITESEAFAENCKVMQREMIRQNYNHPSVIMWTYMNEVLLRPRYDNGSEKREAYIRAVAKLAQELEDLTRAEDPSRYTMIPNHGAFELYHKAGLTRIPKLVGWNLYQGWYGGELGGFAKYLDMHHKELPDKPLLVTEYGADGDPRIHSFEPVKFDKSLEYTLLYHQAYLEAIMERPFVAGAMIWNLADFNSEQRAEAMPHINNKGITTIDRQPKDPYLFYQANLLKQPFIRIGAAAWTLRSGIAASETSLVCVQPVEVFTNQPSVSLRLNGKLIGTAAARQGIARFNVPFADGVNLLDASAGTDLADQLRIQFKMIPKDLRSAALPFREINVSLGSKRYYADEKLRQVWLPEQAYTPGSWGYVGGQAFAMKGGSQSYGSNKDILGTEDDPIYETQRTGLSQFKLDVPAGEYEVTLLFAELVSGIKREALVYNLSNTTQNEEAATRIFDVKLNNVPWLENLGTATYLEPERAYATKTTVSVKGTAGIVIDFTARKGEAVLNGVQVRRVL